MNPIPRTWRATLLLLALYLAIFQVWHTPALSSEEVACMGVVASIFLGVCIVIGGRRGCFVNAWDQGLHAVVVLDILLESLLVGRPETHGFYFCAPAFGAVITGYRHVVGRRGERSANGRSVPTVKSPSEK